MVYDKAYYDEQYQSTVYLDRSAVVLGYHKSVSFGRYATRAQYLIEQGVVRPYDTVLLIGCGYNWLGEALFGYHCRVVAADNSPYIQATYGGSDETDIVHRLYEAKASPATTHRARIRYSTPAPIGFGNILNEDSLTTASRNRVSLHLKDKANVLVLEDVLDDMSHGDQNILIAACREYGAGVLISLGATPDGKTTHKVL